MRSARRAARWLVTSLRARIRAQITRHACVHNLHRNAAAVAAAAAATTTKWLPETRTRKMSTNTDTDTNRASHLPPERTARPATTTDGRRMALNFRHYVCVYKLTHSAGRSVDRLGPRGQTAGQQVGPPGGRMSEQIITDAQTRMEEDEGWSSVMCVRFGLSTVAGDGGSAVCGRRSL